MNDRLLQLLTDEATEGLTPEASDELRTLLAQAPAEDRDQMQLAAAVLHLAMLEAEPAAQARMPDAVRARLIAGLPQTLPPPAEPTSTAPAGDGVVDLAARQPAAAARRFDWRATGWVAAAAMGILWIAGTQQNTSPVDPAPPSLAEQRDALIGAGGQTLMVSWGQSDQRGFEDVTGDVVWNNELQQGFMRLAGLRQNNPGVEQYQLWVVDPERDSNPVDGGVFDISSPGEVIVRIDAKLDILSPAAFAITVEQPGGVVVSDGPLVLVAAVGG